MTRLGSARDSDSEQQIRDVKNIAASGYEVAYMERWTNELGLDKLWPECQP